MDHKWSTSFELELDKPIFSVLDDYIKELREVAQETVDAIGENRCCVAFDLARDGIYVHGAVIYYAQFRKEQSVLLRDLYGLHKEFSWMLKLLLWAQYPILTRNIRFLWELFFRSYYADTRSGLFSIPEKNKWLEERERNLNWGTLIRPILEELLPVPDHPLIEVHYHPLFRRLHQSVHPSVKLLGRTEDTAQLMLDMVDKDWAEEAIHDLTEVSDLIWLVSLRKFPEAMSSLSVADAFHNCPRTRTQLSQINPKIHMP